MLYYMCLSADCFPIFPFEAYDRVFPQGTQKHESGVSIFLHHSFHGVPSPSLSSSQTQHHLFLTLDSRAFVLFPA